MSAGSKYSAEIVAGLTAQLAIFDKNVDSSKVGNREAATRKRDQALEVFKVLLARVRFYYCCVSAEADQTPELAKNWLPATPRSWHGGEADGSDEAGDVSNIRKQST